MSQSATVTSSDTISLVGSFVDAMTNSTRPTNVNGVARSVDGGQSWTLSSTPGGYARYGSFPSEVCDMQKSKNIF